MRSGSGACRGAGMLQVCSHSVFVLQQLQEQRIQGLLCDCVLVVKGVCFKAHKNVLAAFSAYFRSLFQNSPAQKNDVFHLAIQDVSGIGQVLDYMYTSHLELKQDNVHTLMEIAQSLQVLNILNLCQAFLKPSSQPDPEGQLGFGSDAVPPADEQKRQPPHGYKLRNFYTRQYLQQSGGAPPDEPPPSSADPEVTTPPVLRPKKDVYLKKFNYLRTHGGGEEPEGRGVTDAVTSDLSMTSAPAEASELKTTEEPDESRGHDQRSEVTSSSNKYCCEVCGKTFKHPSNLELHKRSHTGEKPFQCNVCGKGFSQAGNLQTHLRRHSGEKPYICELCGKSFAASGDVQRHIIIHSGARPHLCDVCGRGFSNFSNLKEHKKTHSSEREFTCEQCGKSFNMQRKLFKHKLRHSGDKPYSCQTCGKCFAGSGDLQRHVRSHTGERPYACETCGKSFTRTAVLRRHRSSHCRPAVSRSPEGPARAEGLCSSGALWGRAMKTLQSDTDVDP